MAGRQRHDDHFPTSAQNVLRSYYGVHAVIASLHQYVRGQCANEIKRRVVERHKVDPNRLETVGRGWDEPVSTTDPKLNRRVEVQWFLIE